LLEKVGGSKKEERGGIMRGLAELRLLRAVVFLVIAFAMSSSAQTTSSSNSKGVSLDEAIAEEDAFRAMNARLDDARWALILSDRTQLVAYDRKKLRVLGNDRYETWLKWDHAKAIVGTNVDKPYQYTISKREIDCTTLAEKRTVEYSYDADGSVVHSWEAEDPAKVHWSDSVPQSVGEVINARFCRAMAIRAARAKKR
jgi:hypothetical protein